MPFRLASVLALSAIALLTAATSAAAEATLLGRTPLVLKDGRIAHVTVHTVAFPLGRDEPDEPASAGLAALVEELATDCFLTAQAVGHVEPGPGSDGDTLAAHRLARARADRVQAALVGRGLPQNAIASVWDWQFAVREPRVTLWVFRLAEGDDCDATPVARAEEPPAPVAAPVPAAVETPAPQVEPTPAPPASDIVVEAPAQAVPDPGDLVALAAPEPQADLVGVPAEPASSMAEVAPEPGPAQTVAPAETAAPAVEHAPVAIASAEAADEPAATTGAVPPLAITFDVNSSYLPKGTGRELQAMLRDLPPHGRYEALLEGAVSAEALRSRPEADGHAYNRWIADRRMDRVAEWLRRNMGGSLAVRHAYVENDSSRRVTITLRPIP